jgi:hypothetical protein
MTSGGRLGSGPGRERGKSWRVNRFRPPRITGVAGNVPRFEGRRPGGFLACPPWPRGALLAARRLFFTSGPSQTKVAESVTRNDRWEAQSRQGACRGRPSRRGQWAPFPSALADLAAKPGTATASPGLLIHAWACSCQRFLCRPSPREQADQESHCKQSH